MLHWIWRGNTLVRLQARQVPTAKKYEWVLRVSIGLCIIWWTQWGSIGHDLLNWPIIKGGLDSKISLRTISLREPGRPLVTTPNPMTLFTKYYCHCNSFVFPLLWFCLLIVNVGQILGQHRANRPVLGLCGYHARQYRVNWSKANDWLNFYCSLPFLLSGRRAVVFSLGKHSFLFKCSLTRRHQLRFYSCGSSVSLQIWTTLEREDMGIPHNQQIWWPTPPHSQHFTLSEK